MMIPVPEAGLYESVDGVERASAVPGVEEVIITAAAGTAAEPLPEGAAILDLSLRGQSRPQQWKRPCAARTQNCGSRWQGC